MVKILAQAGMSLADVYNVVGSVAGVEQIESREVSVVHEMGATIFSERFSGAIRRLTTGAILQSVSFDLTLADLPAGISRVLGVYVQADAATRIDRCQLSLRSVSDGREIPFFIWDATDSQRNIRIVENDAAVTNRVVLMPELPLIQTMPSLAIGTGQPQQVGEEIVLRGLSSAFGAGTVTLVALVYLGFSRVQGISSRGLPVPGW